jgi:hypothetical protein
VGFGLWAAKRPKISDLRGRSQTFFIHGAAWRQANAGHVSLGQLQVMSAIEQCRSAALDGHVDHHQTAGPQTLVTPAWGDAQPPGYVPGRGLPQNRHLFINAAGPGCKISDDLIS